MIFSAHMFFKKINKTNTNILTETRAVFVVKIKVIKN